MGMAEYIDRKALREAFDNADADIVEEYGDGYCEWGFGRKNILEVINSVPAADVAPVRYSRWKYFRKQNVAVCTNCSFERDLDANFGNAVSCPNCGARMDGDADA